MIYKIKKEQIGERLDKLSKNLLPDLSRSYIQKLIKNGDITVDGKIVSPHHFLKINEKISIKKTNISKSQEIKTVEKPTVFKLKVIDDTKEYLIVNKPAGIPAHGADHIREIALADLIIAKYPEIKKIGEDPSRPGIVHRIDKEVSGLLVIPKTQESFDNLKKQFKNRTVKKQYTALVYGQIKKDEDTINFPIKRSETGHRMSALPLNVGGKKNAEGRQAVTEFKLIKRYINYTLLKVYIKTGRTHQIRVHMSAFGHPIVGDNLYSTKKTRELNKKINLGRIFLFADELSFKDLKGIIQTYRTEMPPELKNFMKKVK